MWIINEDNRMIIHEESEFTLRYKDDDWMSGAEWYKEYITMKDWNLKFLCQTF